MEVADHRFRVMASEARVLLVDPVPGAAELAIRRLEELEGSWSRFRSESDISRLARAGGLPVRVAPETCLLVELMRRAHRLTGGSYDPTMLSEIVDAGYGVSIDGAAPSVTIDLPHPAATIAAAEVDVVPSTVQLPDGMGLDPGGIGKGLAADLVASELTRAGTAGVLVGIGGDLSAVGTAPSPEGWHVAVEDPFSAGRSITAFAVPAGGVATSSTLSRAWSRAGRRRHHVLDPESGGPSEGGSAAVTVFAPSGWEAEIHATAALVRGGRDAVTYLENRGLSGLEIGLHGEITATADLAPSLPARIPERAEVAS